ncbi:MAG TPA: hypothetical protein VHC19_22435, partial [Pirellulales bacterium]|nr:hypothetical protein [Pirellulales bacterium]
MSEAWYCKAFGQELGPMSFADLLELVERSDVLPTDEVKCGDHGAWGAASQEPRLFPQPAHAQVRAPAAEGLAGPEALLAPASSAEPCTGPSAAVTAAAPDANLPEAIEEQRAPQEHAGASEASTPAMPSTGPLNRKRILVCAAGLAICGVSAGAAARILLGAGGAEPRAAVSGGNAVEQQRIALLKQQIDDLMRQRAELASRAGSGTPDQPSTTSPEPAGPSGSESRSKSAASSPAGASSGGPAPADAVPPAPEKTPPEQQPPAADSPKAPASVQQQDEADAKDPATMSAGGQSSKRAASNHATRSQSANAPPAANPAGGAVASAVSAKAAQSGGSLSLLGQAQKRRRQRFELLREIYEQRAGLLVEYAKLQAQVESLESAIAATETAYAEVNAAGAAVLAQIGLAGNATLIQSLMRQYAALDGEASQLKIQRQQQAAEQAELMAKAKKVDEQAAELRSTWLAVVDPFGQLDHGDEDSALASFTEWTVLEPERPGPWLARGFAYWQLGQFDNALA